MKTVVALPMPEVEGYMLEGTDFRGDRIAILIVR